MSRKIDRRLIVTGRLVCQCPLHVGGLEGRSSADLTLAVDGAGRVHIPGTSLAGPLRHWCWDMFGREATQKLWGFQPHHDSTAGHASYVIVEDAVLPEGCAVASDIRDGVGIDRYTGTAAERIKHSREALPAGTAFDLHMAVDMPSDAPWAMPMVAALLQALQAGEIRLGAGKSRGLGAVKLEGLAVEERHLATRKGILALVRSRSPGSSGARSDLQQLWPEWDTYRRVRPLIGIEIDWEPVGPLMVKASADGMTIDTLPLLARHRTGGLRLVLPGSSTKGALRTQAERIATTLLGKPAGQLGFLAQLERHAIVETLLGARNDPRHDSEKDEDDVENAPPLVGLSALKVEDCFSHALLDEATLQYLLGTAPDAGPNDVSAFAAGLPQYGANGAGAPCLDPAMHVAIDRWTGGAADGALFSVLEPWGFGWEPLRLSVDPRRLARRSDDACADDTTVALAALGLLLLTLGDFVGGEVPLGYGANRGLGSVKVKAITVTVPEAQDYHDERVAQVLRAARGLNGRICSGDRLVLERERIQPIAKAWRAYLAAHTTKAGQAAAAGGQT